MALALVSLEQGFGVMICPRVKLGSVSYKSGVVCQVFWSFYPRMTWAVCLYYKFGAVCHIFGTLILKTFARNLMAPWRSDGSYVTDLHIGQRFS